MSALRHCLLLVATVVALVGLRPAVPAEADKIHDGDKDNYVLKIPDSWDWDRIDDLAKLGVKEAAKRRFETLADGKTPGSGEGGRLLLTVQDVPKDLDPDYETWVAEWQALEEKAEQLEEVPEELDTKIDEARAKIDKALEALTAKDEVKSLLLNRWDKDPKGWPPHTVDSNVEIGEGKAPAARVKANGPCPNLDGVAGECDGRLFVWVIRKKMYRLAMWAWSTKHDREHVIDDMDTIELTFEIPNAKAIPKKPPPPGPDPADAPKVVGDAGEVKLLKDIAFGFGVTKPKKFRSVPIDRATPDQANLGFRFDAAQGTSSAIVELLVYRIKGAVVAFNVNEYLTGLWTSYMREHPKGALGTFPFYVVAPKTPYLTLPDFSKKHEVKRTPPDEKVSVSDMERFGVIMESKQITIKKEKVRGAWRWCMTGLAERQGEDTNMHYAFSTAERTYVIRIVVRKDGWSFFKDEIAEMLKSFEILEDPK